ncbi:MAG: hypothetical protein R3F59_02540 [Myxococcota bacterium]
MLTFALSLATPSAAAPPPAAGQRELLCGKAEVYTMDATLAQLDDAALGVFATEGQLVSAVAQDGFARVLVEQMFESARVSTTFLYAGTDLVCIDSMTTTMRTVLAKRDDNPDGIDPAYRRDRWVLSPAGAVLVHHVQEAPAPDQRHVDLDEQKALAPKLRAAIPAK